MISGMAMQSYSGMGPGSVTAAEIDTFLTNNRIDEVTCTTLKECSPEVQRAVLDRGHLEGCWNPSAALRSRIKNLQGDGGQVAGQTFVKLRGLPFTAQKTEVIQFFAPEYLVGDEQVTMGEWSDWPEGQNFTGEAWVDFASEAMVQEVIKAKHKATFLGTTRYIEVFVSTPGECENTHKRSSASKGGRGSAPPGAGSVRTPTRGAARAKEAGAALPP